jgi:hypothetical protein
MFSNKKNKMMCIRMQRLIWEMKFFLTTPIEVHLYTLILLITLSKKSKNNSDRF